ncbi:family 16 glycosylhydrolase [Zeaxanthinibacter sp. PT1]|uniref:family 16 glycosylhydrolase n=1 Tax=Zeaxanthinibacter TaxID=561554 RepID=UPI00234A9838|nr:family 16 glycosylhydrolase [Zeaxanthinibacter sp. PT1]MDC6350926.1 family 16 glycosylhydrolase [Zeaxanthinibacter sp. PT1]
MKNPLIFLRIHIGLCLMLSLGSQLGIAQCPSIVWQDEFSGNTLDTSKWNYQIGDGCAEGICGWGNNELQSYQEANVAVSNGTLKITAQKERIRGSQYTSGRINSKGKGDFTYGRFEASIKLPAGDGLWPAFWMLSTNEPYGGWPQSGEIDIMEFVASTPDEILGYIHYGDPYPNNQSQGNKYTLSNGVFTDNFHEFAIEWEPGEIRWFLDGILYSVKRTEDLSPYTWPFDHDFHFLLNVAVGGNLGGPVNNAMLPATMEVDYVRVYDGFKPYLNGPAVVSNQASSVGYSVENIANNVNITWSVPTGASIVSGQGTSSIVVDFGAQSGPVSATFNDGCSAQALTIDVEVEPPYVYTYSFENFDDTSSAIYASSTGTLTEVGNPGPDAVNMSALSGKYDRNGGEQYDILVYNISSISNATSYTNKDKKFFMDVFTTAPAGTEVLIQLETSTATATNYPSGRHSRYVASITTNNRWERLEFTLLDRPDPSASETGIEHLILLFNSNSFTNDTYYFDNLDSYDADTGSTANQAPSVNITAPSDGSTFSEGTAITITADASDSDGSIDQVEFFADGASVGIDFTEPYSVNWQVAPGATGITAVASDNEGANTTSSVITVNGQAGGEAVSTHVGALTTGTASAGKGQKYGTATITVNDNLGNPVNNATVSGTFSGTFSEVASAVTGSDGVVVLQTTGSAKGTLTVNFCVDSISHASLTYQESDNTITCSGTSAKGFLSVTGIDSNPGNFSIYPNPTAELLRFSGYHVNERLQLEVYDLIGRLVYSKNIDGIMGQLDVSALTKGLYILHVKKGLEKMQTFSFYKQ